MKGNYKRIYFLGILVLLLLSCSLTSPTPSPSDELTQSASLNSKPRVLRPLLNEAKPKLCTVETGYEEGLVNLRLGAGVTFEVLIVLKEGTRLEILNRGDWLKVSTVDGVVGYINSKYCRIGE